MSGLRHVALAFLALSLAPAPAGAQPARGRVVVVTIDATTFDDWDDPGLPNLGRLLDEGGLALLSTRTAGEGAARTATEIRADAYATLGAGARAREATAERDASGPLGALHVVLSRAGAALGAYGSADGTDAADTALTSLLAIGRPRRTFFAPTLADPLFPTGRRTDYPALRLRLERDLPSLDVAFVDTGDTTRVDRSLGAGLGRRERWVRLSLERADAFLGWLRTRLGARDQLIVLSTEPPATLRRRGILLAPAIRRASGAAPGTLTSGTTRRAGVLSLADVAPTILDALDLPVPAEMEGRAAMTEPGARARERVEALERDLEHAREMRRPVSRGMLAAGMALVALAWATVVAGRGRARSARLPHGWRDFLATAMLAAAAVPAASFLEPLLPTASRAAGLVAVGAIAVGLAVSLRVAAGAVRGLILLCALTAAIVLADLALGTPLASRSALGFQVAGGGRFFGIDETTMGIGIGALLFAVAPALDLARHPSRLLPWAAAACAAAVMLMGAPSFGSKFGAPFTAVPAFGVLAVRAGGRRLDRVAVLAIAIATVFVSATFAAADALRSPEAQTHIGRAFGGETAIGPLVGRKLGSLLHITFTTIWLPALVVFAGAPALLALRRRMLVARGLWGHPSTRAALWAAGVGAVAALASNDTGVITAAPLAMFGAASFFIHLLTGAAADQARIAGDAPKTGDFELIRTRA